MHRVLLSVISFAMFFLFSMTWHVEGGSGLAGMGVQIDTVMASGYGNTQKTIIDKTGTHKAGIHKTGTHKADIHKTGTHKADIHKTGTHKADIHKKDNDNDNDAVSNDNDADDTDASCVCPPGVSACVCADGTSGDPGTPSNGVPQRNSMRSIHGDS